MSSVTPTFSSWLNGYLNELSKDIDADVYGDYIGGLLEDDTLEKDEIIESINDFLSAVLPPQSAKSSSEHIYTRYLQKPEEGDTTGEQATTSSALEHAKLDNLESQMRSLLAKPQEDVAGAFAGVSEAGKPMGNGGALKERDAVTVAALRAAGVSGYQGSAEEEGALAVALADAEFIAKQKVSNGTSGGMLPPPLVASTASSGRGRSSKTDAFDSVLPSTEPETIDLEDIEDAQGYGKKDGIKPMNVMDALSALAPEKFATSQTTAMSKEELKSAHSKRLPTPGDINSHTPAYLLLASRTNRIAVAPPVTSQTSATAATGSNTSTPPQLKKKSAPPSKHLADIGARAEEKHRKMMERKNQKLSNISVNARNRLDDMDAFFMSDEDDAVDEKKLKKGAKGASSSSSSSKPVDILNEGGGNRERVKQAERSAREAAAKEHARRVESDKAERTRQLEAQAKRKATAQQKAQKQERRRR